MGIQLYVAVHSQERSEYQQYESSACYHFVIIFCANLNFNRLHLSGEPQRIFLFRCPFSITMEKAESCIRISSLSLDFVVLRKFHR